MPMLLWSLTELSFDENWNEKVEISNKGDQYNNEIDDTIRPKEKWRKRSRSKRQNQSAEIVFLQ